MLILVYTMEIFIDNDVFDEMKRLIKNGYMFHLKI